MQGIKEGKGGGESGAADKLTGPRSFCRVPRFVHVHAAIAVCYMVLV
jgi:hypothetical protein